MRFLKLKIIATAAVAALHLAAVAQFGDPASLVVDEAGLLTEPQIAEARDTLAAANKHNVNFRLFILPRTPAAVPLENYPGNTIAIVLGMDGKLSVNPGRKFQHAGRAHVREIIARRVEDHFLPAADRGDPAEALLATLRELSAAAPQMGESSHTFTLLVGCALLLAVALMLFERRGKTRRKLAFVCLAGCVGVLAYVLYERYVPLSGAEALEYSFNITEP